MRGGPPIADHVREKKRVNRASASCPTNQRCGIQVKLEKQRVAASQQRQGQRLAVTMVTAPPDAAKPPRR